jgi:hypothetical protein
LKAAGESMSTPEQKKNNLKLGLVLASVALTFFLGFMAKLVFLGK